MKLFPQDSTDPIEQIYARKILRRFPLYGEFWTRFIGLKMMGNYVLPYGLIVPSSIPRSERIVIKRAYEEMNMAHYSLFCHLAGAHFQIAKLSYPVSSRANWFQHWEAFESAYTHLGNCFYQVHHLWDLLFLVRGKLRRRKGRIVQIRRGPRKWDLIHNEFKMARKLKFLKDFVRVKRRISARRDNIVHYARGASMGTSQSLQVPLRVRRNVPWSRQLRRGRRFIHARRLADRDLRDTEQAINSCHRVLIDALENLLVNKGLRIQS
jgi:hypothetical protein